MTKAVKKNHKKQVKKEDFSRPPIVVILGHVDSGKTSLLDYICKTHIAPKESGGITQRIDAYQIDRNGEKMTFIDTPGHEAFSIMRSRGAKVADIAVLVVDATQGVQDQTKESIFQIKSSGIPFIVALNKIDMKNANPEKCKRELIKEDVLVESMGGQVPSVGTSARDGKGVDELLDLILLIAEMEELKGDLLCPAGGVIIESYMDSQRGPVASLILTEGILKPGSIVATSSSFGKIKKLEDFRGRQKEEIRPSDPAIVIGFESSPQSGEKFQVFSDIEKAEEFIAGQDKEEKQETVKIKEGQKFLDLVIRADALGSLEAMKGLFKNIPQEKVVLRILDARVGDVCESDVKLAKSGPAKIIAFSVKISPIARMVAEKENVRIISFEIIYELTEAVRILMEKIVEPDTVRNELGKIRVLVDFLTKKGRQIVGGKIIGGEITRGVQLEVIRPARQSLGAGGGGETVGKGKIIELQKDKKVKDKLVKGDECGILFEGNVKIMVGDILQAYKDEKQKGTL
ncbi:MAG: translation initiation factor IF-2 [Candidatus Nealsonbacteria bacterium CG_4_8_14_3_um_filter_39_7]|nr:MAG: translation initiation factor IF-2 [Candidatus Nealsonbacteria bacterium CG_4_8_14_3_um_filter_39_7]